MYVRSKESFIGKKSSEEQSQDDSALHMPDLLFVRFCEDKFGINRGIYNTIDQWFFHQGINQIIERRNIILAFFYSLKLKENKQEKVKFGSKGLTEKLNVFFQKQLRNEKVYQQAK